MTTVMHHVSYKKEIVKIGYRGGKTEAYVGETKIGEWHPQPEGTSLGARGYVGNGAPGTAVEVSKAGWKAMCQGYAETFFSAE